VLLFLLLPALPFSCTKEKTPELTPSSVTAQQLAADASFVRMVEANTQLTGILYGKLRGLGADEARREMMTRVRGLLGNPTNANVLRAMQGMGFETPAQFAALTNELLRSSHEVEERFGEYRKRTDGKVLDEAYRLSLRLGNATLTQYWFRAKAAQRSPGQGTFCPECHFNNCDDCNSGGGSSEACLNNCLAQKEIALLHANTLLIDDMFRYCGGWGSALQYLEACFMDPSCPKVSREMQVYLTFMERVQNFENSASQCARGCF